MTQRAMPVAIGLVVLVTIPAGAAAQTAGVTPPPIPQRPMAGNIRPFDGSPATPDPFSLPLVPRNPFMAPNGLSNLHDDAYQTDTYRWSGPLGPRTATQSAFYVAPVLARECASITFDSRRRLVAICVGLDRPVVAIIDPRTLTPLATYPLPPRQAGSGDPFTDFSGGGYFYLGRGDRVVAPTTTRHIFVIAETPGPGLERRRDYDVSGRLAADDKIISALPDWDGRIWFASRDGVVGWVNRQSGKAHTRDLGAPIGNSFAVDELRGVYTVTDAALYRLTADDGRVRIVWRHVLSERRRRQARSDAGGARHDADDHGRRAVRRDHRQRRSRPHHGVQARAARPRGRRVVCRVPVFHKGRSSTDQSLIGAGKALIAENNYGYSIPATQNGGVTAPGLERVDVNRAGRGCHKVWHSDARAPSVVPKVSARAGLVYTYTKPPRSDDQDAWYLTALDFDTGRRIWRRLAGEGLGYNNNYAPVTIAPNGTAYVGVLGGLVKFRDAPGR